MPGKTGQILKMKLEYTKELKYDELQDIAHSIVGELEPKSWETNGGDEINEWFRFSIFETVDNEDIDNWIVSAPDIESNKPLAQGTFDVVIRDWGDATTVMTDPTWKDILIFFANNHDGHHGFLEDVRMARDCTQTIELITGS